ncbi:cytochrome P450/oxidoreductase [Saccharopolyspora sp. NFXS83]|uniref:cytochrome P450/oxidoreductase n=1 Tax=Saccharopolyspora sp. NFXS83 TaxID=2993560 RepID=UPI00224AE0CB|nr:cytochrome P450/oxidoreductase [Saccharopolyspora sp. NFXS83]MCX2729323.1 cytochrome P450/oxidoreductase [Saccharopolyspora sp. NFXS83]
MSAGSCPVAHSISAGAAAFDPFGERYQADPPASLRWSRDEEPVFYSPEIGYWVVTRYADVQAVFRDNVLFSPSIALEKITPVSAAATRKLAEHGYAMDRTLVNEDEPAHQPRRRALMGSFAPEALAEHEPMVRGLARDYVDRFVDAGEADLVDEMFWEVTLTVALHFLGVPEEDMPTLRKYSIAHTVNTWGRPSPEQQVAVADAVGHFWRFAGEVVAKLRADPSGPGWMPCSIRLQREMPEIITDSYLHSMMMAGIVAAHETTANAAANAVKSLLENRSAWDELCADPSLISNAVEECLRHNGSVAAWRRLATADAEIGGVRIPRGAKLLIVNSSANHDERHFDDPDGFDIRRDNAADHLTFGYGSHQCLGKNLARMELQVFLEELTSRLPHMERVPGRKLTYLPNTSFRGPEHLWVRWDPAANPERREPGLLGREHPVRIGEPVRRALARAVVVEAVEPVAEGVVSVALAGSGLPRWTPGAHIDVELGELSRQYSLCGDPADPDRYRIAVLREPESRGGSRFVHDRLEAGQVVRIRGPRNHFRLAPDTGGYVFVAGGIGITPIIAMADHARAAGADYEIHYCGRDDSTMAFLDRLRREHGDALTVHARGARLDVAALLAEPVPGRQVYACGPRVLLDALDEAMRHWPEDSLHVEHFGAAQALLDPAREHAFDAELADSGGTVAVPADGTLLSALRAAGVDVPSDCEEGLCGSCEVAVLDGAIDHRDGVLTKAERAAGRSMLTCCSRARGTTLRLGL